MNADLHHKRKDEAVRSKLILAVATLVALGGVPAVAQDMEWDSLPEPRHLSRVLDVNVFLGQGGPVATGARYVQVGAFRRQENAEGQIERIRAVGLEARLGRQGSWYLVLMPETERNTAEVLAGWARRSGYPDAFIRVIR